MPTRRPIRPPVAVPSHCSVAGRVLRRDAAVRAAFDDGRAEQLDLPVCVELLEPGEPGVGRVVVVREAHGDHVVLVERCRGHVCAFLFSFVIGCFEPSPVNLAVIPVSCRHANCVIVLPVRRSERHAQMALRRGRRPHRSRLRDQPSMPAVITLMSIGDPSDTWQLRYGRERRVARRLVLDLALERQPSVGDEDVDPVGGDPAVGDQRLQRRAANFVVQKAVAQVHTQLDVHRPHSGHRLGYLVGDPALARSRHRPPQRHPAGLAGDRDLRGMVEVTIVFEGRLHARDDRLVVGHRSGPPFVHLRRARAGIRHRRPPGEAGTPARCL